MIHTTFTPIADSHDTPCDELRDRIAAGERSKLTKQERAEMALHFMELIFQPGYDRVCLVDRLLVLLLHHYF